MAILNNSNAISSGVAGYDINNSLRLRSNTLSSYLSRTPASTGSRTIFTYSAWVKTSVTQYNSTIFSAVNAALSGACFIRVHGDGGVDFGQYNTGADFAINTVALCRDPAAWYHIVVAVDDTQATSSNRVKIYINGVQQTLTGTYPTQNQVLLVNDTKPHYVGKFSSVIDQYFDGYLAEVNFINASQLTPSDFGETDTTTGSWKPKAYTGTYGTNGFYLKFSDIATTSGSNAGLGKDFSGNANYFNTNNISVTAGTTYDAMIDSPTLTSATVANYATMNPLKSPVIGTYSNANLTVAFGTNDFTPALATIYPTSGKWYWEAVWVSGTYSRLGVQNTTVASTDFGADSGGWRWGSNDGQIYNGTNLITVATYATGDVLGFCLDLDAGKLYVSKNGTWQNSAVPASGTGAVATNIPTNTPMSPAGSTGYLPTTNTWNFGQRPFAYTPPTGFVRLNTYNLPDSTIKKGSSYMDATLWTGTGATLSITNAGAFKPDLVWAKTRSAVSSNLLYDSIRGVNQYLSSNQTAAEATLANSLTAFNSNGFTVGSDSNINGSGVTNVGWQWQAGQGSTSSNTAGSITSTVSVNATAGFSIATFTSTGAAATVGHGLGVAPRMIIVKARNNASGWAVYHASVGNTGALRLDTTAATSTTIDWWRDTSPTSSVFSIGANFPNAYTSVAYCWADVSGYSKAFSYTGNGSTDGPMVYLGFKPKFIMIKRTDSTSSWFIHDTARDTYNVSNKNLYPNLSAAEEVQTTWNQDILSNGFKTRGTSAELNANGGTYIGMAFSSNPFKNSTAV